jgi:hypothetical protein
MNRELIPSSEPLTVCVVAGPNGAGKTTFATEFLPGFVHFREFLNADLMAAKTDEEPMIFHAVKYDALRQLAGTTVIVWEDGRFPGRRWLQVVRSLVNAKTTFLSANAPNVDNLGTRDALAPISQ